MRHTRDYYNSRGESLGAGLENARKERIDENKVGQVTDADLYLETINGGLVLVGGFTQRVGDDNLWIKM